MSNPAGVTDPHREPDDRKSLFNFLVTGFFIVLPLLLAAYVLVQFYGALESVIRPLLEALPGTVFHDPRVRLVVVGLAILVLLMLVGWAARLRVGQTIGRLLEMWVLNRIPFYRLLRNLASGLAGKEEAHSMKTVLVTVDVPGLQQLGLLIERHADGNSTVFLPSSPNPGSGTVVVVDPSRIEDLPMPVHEVFRSMSRWGDGTAAGLEKARRIERGADDRKVAQQGGKTI